MQPLGPADDPPQPSLVFGSKTQIIPRENARRRRSFKYSLRPGLWTTDQALSRVALKPQKAKPISSSVLKPIIFSANDHLVTQRMGSADGPPRTPTSPTRSKGNFPCLLRGDGCVASNPICDMSQSSRAKQNIYLNYNSH